jgi:hypothetical protein
MKSSIKTLYRTAVAVALLTGLTFALRAQVVIGSWQSAPIPPSPANDEGWYSASGGLANLGSVFASSNMPVNFDLVTNVAAGYAQSLVVHEYGYGNIRLAVSLNASQIAAFTNNSQFNFTFSVQPGSTQYSAGYIQMVQFQYNSSAGGFHAITPSTSAGFSETGDTGNNSSGQPIYYFYSSAPARQQVVTWDYSSAKTNMVGSSYVQFVFVFQVGGGAPTNIYINNVTLSGATVPTIIVDQFNPTNNPYAGTNIYASGDITNIYANWFGSAFSNVVWDASSDAQSNANSGSLKITANFGTSGGDQFLVMDKGPSFSYAGINPPITNGIGLLTFECDVRYDTNSPTWIIGGGTNYGNLQIGIIPPYTSQDVIGATTISVTNTANNGWVHVTLPLNAVTDPNLLSFSGIFIKMDGASYGNLQGTTTLWVDNLAFTYTNITIVPSPVMTVQKATPGLRIFAGSTVNTYDRAELATIDNNQSWIGGSYPVSYSFRLLSYPANINQTHIFLVPVNTSGQANMGNVSGSVNEYIDYQASNGMWLVLQPFGGGQVTASVMWKTNLANANPNRTALVFTNPTAIGTWTLTFSNDNSGAVTAPGGASHDFTITNGTVATDFANPLVAYFGIQPNSSTGMGQFEDWASISVTGVAGVNENDNFTTDTSFNTGLWNINTPTVALSTCVQLVTANTPYWLNWTLPAVNYDVGTGTNILAPGTDNTTGGWMLPEYYNNYNDGNSLPGQAQQGSKIWVLLPTTCMPTVNGSPGGALAPKAFYRLFNPPLAN